MDPLSIVVAVVVGIVSGVLASIITARSQRAISRRNERLDASKILLTFLRALEDHRSALAYYQDSHQWIDSANTVGEVETARRAAFTVKGYLDRDAQEAIGLMLFHEDPDGSDLLVQLTEMISVLKPAIESAFPSAFYR